MVRFKNRYLLIELIFNPNLSPSPSHQTLNLNEKILTDIIRSSISENFGEFGAGQSSSSLTA
ncbi:hypothetical protein CROQUDRAFT_243268 [Cronartium quercuum f. sp. fusiforme G11]|uniref:Uncharacterized protein n=1 Tax=Cronartium quercuum f. sp. fusiforme G11 TaxID=708437 RepID=A0A9P6T7Q5_9BASI|nr:hypothetical protein CROQUDRAFT_243268 [Cronartium quercuum f. sp. fusiforme G11]